MYRTLQTDSFLQKFVRLALHMWEQITLFNKQLFTVTEGVGYMQKHSRKKYTNIFSVFYAPLLITIMDASSHDNFSESARVKLE